MAAKIKYLDLFAGLGGIRIGLEQALEKDGLKGECVAYSEIKEHAILVYEKNFPGTQNIGDIKLVNPADIPDFNILLAGFPCQPFTSAGTRKGFLDTRGTLFFNIEEILRIKRPDAFLLENVEGLVTHDRVDRKQPIGRTLNTILLRLEGLGYKTTWKVLDSSKHGVPQKRKRIYIVGSLNNEVSMEHFKERPSRLSDVIESSKDDSLTIRTPIAKKLLNKFPPADLMGKQIKDKRGGKNNIHSWDIELKGAVTLEQKMLLEAILRQRRRKNWASQKGIKWSDGMPLTLEDIATFCQNTLFDSQIDMQHLKSILDDLVDKKYLSFEVPKQAPGREDLRGYNIVAGKLSFGISSILDPEGLAPTLVAMDATKIAVLDKEKIRRLSKLEGLRLFGFPENYDISPVRYAEAFDLLGNSVTVSTVSLICHRMIREVFLDSVDSPHLQYETIHHQAQFSSHSQLRSA
jgi:DNA (cytosine-5)-methyltransferase 1